MKKIIFIVIVLVSFNCKSQDTIEMTKLSINGVNILGKDKSLLISNFGQPSEIISSYSEMDENQMYEYKYNGLTVYVINNFVDSFILTNSIFSLSPNNIKIGNNISSIENIFPYSYSNRKRDYLKLDIKNSDMFLTIEFNHISKIITKINIGNY